MILKSAYCDHPDCDNSYCIGVGETKDIIRGMAKAGWLVSNGKHFCPQHQDRRSVQLRIDLKYKEEVARLWEDFHHRKQGIIRRWEKATTEG